NTLSIQLVQVVILLLLESVVATENDTVVVVQTLAGSVAGKVEETKLHGIFVEKFLNIHYAEAPVGKLRFMKPCAKKPWKDALNKVENIYLLQEHLSISEQ
ncbi:AGAP010913-PA, partial, partial [Paramuricea clavata]